MWAPEISPRLDPFRSSRNDRTFSPRWQVSSAGPVMYPAGVAYDGNVPKQVIFSSGNPNPQVRALDVATGAELWSVPDVALGQHIHQGVVYYGDLNDNSLKARSTSDGTLIWRFTNPRNFNFQRPTAAGGVVWATTEGNQIYALRVSDGAVLWEVEINGHPGVPVVHFDHTWGTSLVAVAEQNGAVPGYLKAFDPNTGRALWTSSDPVSQPGGSCTDPIVIPHFENGFQVQVGTFDGTLMTFSASNGQLLWQRPLSPGLALIASPHWASW
jgi:outer membrane protein assembly factor BamB